MIELDETEGHWIGGAVAVEAVLATRRRPVHEVLLQSDRRDSAIARIEKSAVALDIPVERATAATFKALDLGNSAGGVAARVGGRNYESLDALIANDTVPALVMLDGVEDPYNIGQALRALYALGITGAIYPERNYSAGDGIILRASAGASEFMPLALAESAVAAAHYYRGHGLTIAGTSRGAAMSLASADLSQPLFVVIGGEKRGISRDFWDLADLRLTIPYGRPFDWSLGTVASAAVLAAEIARQRSP